MAKEVRLPQLGQTMEEGTVVNCLIKEGDQVQKGDVIFEVETDKATLEMESPNEGFVKQVLVPRRDHVSVGVDFQLVCVFHSVILWYFVKLLESLFISYF